MFNEEIIKQLKLVGWFEDRSLKDRIQFSYSDTPEFLKEFLYKYGELVVKRVPHQSLSGEAELHLFSEMEQEDLEGDNYIPYYQSIIGRKLYPLGAYLPDGYYICCDVDGRVYMIGEYCYYRGKNLYEGVENILLGWNNCLQLDEDTGKWWNDNTQHVPLP